MTYIEISDIFNSEMTKLTYFYTSVTIPSYNNINNDTNDINISKQFMRYIYFFTHQLYYNFLQ